MIKQKGTAIIVHVALALNVQGIILQSPGQIFAAGAGFGYDNLLLGKNGGNQSDNQAQSQQQGSDSFFIFLILSW